MNPRSETYRDLTAKADAAFRQAAVKVVQRARQTGTPVIVWQDGRIVELSADQAEMLLENAAGSP